MRTELPITAPAPAVTAPHECRIQVGGTLLVGELVVPEPCEGLVVFAHDSGSSRHSPRDRVVATELRARSIGTLQFDLRSAEEESLDRIIGWLRVDTGQQAERIAAAVRWLQAHPVAKRRRIGLFGSGSGATAALLAAADLDPAIAAVVSRCGRPDLARGALTQVRAATLLLAEDRDRALLAGNRKAMDTLAGEKELVVLGEADHPSDDPDASEQVASLAATWFTGFLGTPAPAH
jgi:putative phosphoribosyl transferase